LFGVFFLVFVLFGFYGFVLGFFVVVGSYLVGGGCGLVLLSFFYCAMSLLCWDALFWGFFFVFVCVWGFYVFVFFEIYWICFCLVLCGWVFRFWCFLGYW